MSKIKPLPRLAPPAQDMETFTFTLERDEVLNLIAALYLLEERLERPERLSQRADNVFEVDGYGYPSVGEIAVLREKVIALREKINGG